MINNYNIQKIEIIRGLFILGLYSVLFNFYDLPLLGLVDIFVILAVICAILWKKLSLVTIIIGIILHIITTTSNLNGLLRALNTDFEHLAFYYKWSFVFFIVVILQSGFASRSAAIELNKHILIVGVMLSIWCVVYTPLRLNGYLTGSWRVSFPFSTELYASDAHVIGSLLGMILSVNYLNNTLKIYSFTTLLFLTAILMTGSRTGIVLIIFSSLPKIIFSFMLPTMSTKRLSRNLFYRIVFSLPVLVSGYVIIGDIRNIDMTTFNKLVRRALDLGIEDASSQGRLRKLGVAIDEMIASGSLFGPGFLQSKLRWYDNGFAILITHGGLLLVIFLGLLFVCLIFKNIRYTSVIMQLFLILIAYTITEQFLISRHVVFIVSLVWVSVQLNKSPGGQRQSYVS